MLFLKVFIQQNFAITNSSFNIGYTKESSWVWNVVRFTSIRNGYEV